jgi:hypothetical protein
VVAGPYERHSRSDRIHPPGKEETRVMQHPEQPCGTGMRSRIPHLRQRVSSRREVLRMKRPRYAVRFAAGAAGLLILALTSIPTSTASAATIARPAHQIIPMNHTGCNDDVCIQLESQGGSGPDITAWNTEATFTVYTCAYPVWLSGVTPLTHGPYYCGTGSTGWVPVEPGLLGDKFAPGTKLCNEWVSYPGYPAVPGYPCATVG